MGMSRSVCGHSLLVHESSEHGRLAGLANPGHHNRPAAFLPPHQPKYDGERYDADENADDKGHHLLRIPLGDAPDDGFDSINERLLLRLARARIGLRPRW